jgi:hypothetical protein
MPPTLRDRRDFSLFEQSLSIRALPVESVMSEESQRLRRRAADQLRQSRRATSDNLKTIHSDQAVALKAMAAAQEWLDGEPLRSGTPVPKPTTLHP